MKQLDTLDIEVIHTKSVLYRVSNRLEKLRTVEDRVDFIFRCPFCGGNVSIQVASQVLGETRLLSLMTEEILKSVSDNKS